MATSGLLAVWSYRLFPDQPAAGLNATVLFLGLGAVIGPALFGALADLWNLRAALLLIAAIAMVTLGARPRAEPLPSP
jgi:predicted MFS family arabinose efflux permease